MILVVISLFLVIWTILSTYLFRQSATIKSQLYYLIFQAHLLKYFSHTINIELKMYTIQQQNRINIFNDDRRPINFINYAPQICPNCKKVKEGLDHQCKIACLYCHDLHLTKDLIENLCPVMYPVAKKAQEKNSYQCKVCKGEGLYTQETETIKYEQTKKYEARLKGWNFSRNMEQSLQIYKPARRILFHQKKVKQVKCIQCQGKGRIVRLVSCCPSGCVSCNGDRFKINPVWKKYRTEPTKNQALFTCSICLMDVEQNADKYTLECKHEFHYYCIFRWINTSKNCPVCRQRDIYLQGMQLPYHNENGLPEVLYLPEISRSEGDESWQTD